MYSHLSCNDKTGGLDFADASGWFRASTIKPLAGSYATYGSDAGTPWIELKTDAGAARLIGVAWTLHSGSRPPDTATTKYFAVAASAYIAVSATDAVDSIYLSDHRSSFDDVYGNGTSPTVAEALGKHPIDLLSPFAKERIDGSDLADIIRLNNSGSEAYGNGGKDSLTGGGGDDRMDGGAGKDALAGAGAQDKLFGGDGNDSLSGQGDNDELHGGAGNDLLYGGDAQDTVYGDAGKDKLFGDEDNDHLYGGSGKDKIHGGIGQDDVYGDAGNDALYGDDDNDRLFGSDGKDALYGGIGQDKLYGDAGDDTLSGDDDNDELYGSDGNDTLHGGIGQDLLNGDAGKDSLHGDADNDVLNGLAGSDKLSGGIGQDKLFGGTGKDTLRGNADNDRLDGGIGNDLLYGGGGANQFVFDTALGKSNIDRIGDFKVGADSIELASTIFTALSPGELPDSAFHRGARAHDADDRILYDPRSGALIYDWNGDAKGGAIVFAKLTDHLPLSHTDFLVN